ncbi:39S ribosomal protein L47, mitochondrial [Aphelenchoides besseyi]|nr:39S ribosomal protein L47, mitochondrial [Aphelenchoides besseyi]KAI6194744.1 39S ribosomal protein L47, mitochondrial [Aphelenchoides besseyi]
MLQRFTRSLIVGASRRNLHRSSVVRLAKTRDEVEKEMKEEEERKEKDLVDIDESLKKTILYEFFEAASLDSTGEVRLKNRPGRSWSVEELRLKSNSDLHKLWYVLLKERNVLLTMRSIRQLRGMKFPNPERFDKIKESMENLESVIHERNDAVLRLETGDSASPPMRTITSFMGFTYQKQATEHYEPAEVTKEKEYEVPYLDDDAYVTQKLWNEKQEMKRRIHEFDEYTRINQTKDDIKFKRAMRRKFDRLEHLPNTIVQQEKLKLFICLMSQPSPMASAELNLGKTLNDRLEALNEVDRKVENVMELVKSIMENLIKDNKPIASKKINDTMRQLNRILEDDINKVIHDQLTYMEELCVGMEHQGSTFGLQNRRDTFRQTLDGLHRELETLLPAEEEGITLCDKDPLTKNPPTEDPLIQDQEMESGSE